MRNDINVEDCDINGRNKKACRYFPKYSGKNKPRCNCKPCWDKYTQTQREAKLKGNA